MKNIAEKEGIDAFGVNRKRDFCMEEKT